MKTAFLSFFITTYFALSAHSFAASVQNMDQKSHTLLVSEPQKAYSVVLEPLGYIQDLCDPCTIEVLGFSILDVENVPLVKVTQGRLEIKK